MANQPDRGNLNPDYVAGVEFNLSRRGYEPAEVRALLREVAGNLTALHAREAQLTQRLAAAESAEPAPAPALSIDQVDEADLTAILGEKTTQVLQSARDAAADIHRRAVDKARDLVDQATADTQRIRAEAEATARSSKDRCDELERKAEQRAKQLTLQATSEAERARTDAEQAVRTARQQADDVMAQADATAQGTTMDADAYAARARAKADTLVTTARAEAEQLEADTQTRVNGLLRDAEESVAVTHAEANAEVTRTLVAAEAEAERLRLDAEHRAAHTEEAGRATGRELVAEAMAARERVLRDLAQHRRNAQVQLAQLRNGRDRLLEAYAVVRATADQATAELDDVLTEARLAAETAADRATSDETKLSLEQLEAEFGVDRLREAAVLRDDEPSLGEESGDETGTEGAVEEAAAAASEDAEVDIDLADEDPAHEDPAQEGPGQEGPARTAEPSGVRSG